MKQDNLDQLIKDSLESVQPEVPAHLWDNIRAGIQPASPSADSGAQTGASSSGSVGSAGLFKIGAAAVALIGGGLLVWHLSADAPADEKSMSSVTSEQNDVSVPETKTTAKISELSEDISPVVEESQGNITAQNGGEIETIEADMVVAENVNSKTTDAKESEGSVVAEESTNKASSNQILVESDLTAQEEPLDLDEDQATAVDGVAHEDNSEEIIPDDRNQSSEIAEQFVLVEAGVLADKVSGEIPLTVSFSNITMAKSYDWNFDNGRKSTDASPEMTFNEPGDYSVRLTVTDFEGNVFSDLIEVSVYQAATLLVPNAFSPNDDGENDYYFVEGANISSVKYKVYRLDGSLVFEGDGLDDKWDGQDSQSPLGDKYHVVVTAIRESGEPIFERVLLHVFRD